MEEKLGDPHLQGGVLLLAAAAVTTTTLAAAAAAAAAEETATVREACSKWKGLVTCTVATMVGL